MNKQCSADCSNLQVKDDIFVCSKGAYLVTKFDVDTNKPVIAERLNTECPLTKRVTSNFTVTMEDYSNALRNGISDIDFKLMVIKWMATQDADYLVGMENEYA